MRPWSCFQRGLLSTLAVLVGLVWAFPVLAYTPFHPKVRQMVDQGVRYLESAPPGNLENHLGGKCLLAMAIAKHSAKYKDVTPHDHPKVKAAVQAVRDYVTGGPASLERPKNYSIGIATIFLLELDAERYRSEIQQLLKKMMERQRPDGSWSYDGEATGDTSQTQYAVLALWSAFFHELPMSEDSVASVCNWLLRTQAPSGAWAYQGIDPGAGNYTRVGQTRRITPSTHVAGLGSAYMAADALGFVQREKSDDGKPKALKKVGDDDNQRRQASDKVPLPVLKRALSDGDRSFAGKYNIRTNHWQYYYMYGLERYQSFRELARGDTDSEPAWYNDGVDYLAKHRVTNGSWIDDNQHGSAPINTAFAVLFLLRSTQEAIKKTIKGEGLLVGGRGLPKDASRLRQSSDGKVIVPKEVVDFDNFVAELDDEEFSNLDALLETARQIPVDLTSPKREAQLDKLRQMVAGESYQKRLVAVRALARANDLQNIPALIYALSDPDARVVREARDGLRFLSRKFDGFGLSDEPTAAEQAKAQDDWKRWYLSIRPDADLEYLQ